MKIMVAFLGKRKNKRNEYIEQIKNIHKNKIKKNIYTQKRMIFDSKNESRLFDSNVIDYLKFKEIKEDKNFSIKKYSILCMIIFVLLFKFQNLEVFLVEISNKYRQADRQNFTLSSVISTMSLFNKENYIQKERADNTTQDNIEEVIENESESDEYTLIDEQAQNFDIEQVFSANNTNVNINSETSTLQKISVDDIWILNYSSMRNIDFKSIMEKNINLTKKSDKILLYNTHTSESYSNSEKYKFEYSSVMRSLDARYNMLAIAKELNDNLLKKGFESIHDTTPHDYGAYTGAYMKSRETVINDLTKINGAGIIMDIHRDAMEDLTFRPIANVNGVEVAQVMFVIGVGTGENKYWEDNLRLALKLQKLANKVYPGLCRQMIIRDSTYNQDLNKYSLLVEFGATGNTIDEVKLSTRCLANLLNIIYKD